MAMSDFTCSVDGCPKRAKSRGLCNRHYENVRRYGYAIPRKDWTVNEILDDAGWTVTESGCWEWNGRRNEYGYGLFNLKRRGYVNYRAHRAMYERFVGPIPDGMVIRHKCDNPPCVNPDHLEVGTDADNVQDMIKRGRHYRSGTTECTKGHDLTAPGSFRVENRVGRSSERVCLRCQRERHLRWREKKNMERAKLREEVK